jgi:hypothetical protein
MPDVCDVGHPVEDASIELYTQIRVRITARTWDRHPSVAGLSGLRSRGQELPFAGHKADDPDATLEVFPVTGDFTSRVLFFTVEVRIDERLSGRGRPRPSVPALVG